MSNKGSILWIIIALLAAVILLYGSGVMGFGTIIMLLFWGAVIWLVVSLVNASTKNTEVESAHTILKKRYAKGKITKEQYLEMREEIKRN